MIDNGVMVMMVMQCCMDHWLGKWRAPKMREVVCVGFFDGLWTTWPGVYCRKNQRGEQYVSLL